MQVHLPVVFMNVRSISDLEGAVCLWYYVRFVIPPLQEDVLNSLGCNMGSFSWVGSLVPLYEKQLSCITPLTEHPIEAVRVWAKRTQSSLKEKIRRETNTDEERSALYR